MNDGYGNLADYLAARRPHILDAWREAVTRDPHLTSGSAMPRAELYDHIPAMLSSFERRLRSHGGKLKNGPQDGNLPQDAAAHGLHRWQQGYDLRDVTGELGRLNECVVAELNNYENACPGTTSEVMRGARCIWAQACTEGISESVIQYYRLRQMEAAGHVSELEAALEAVRELESQRAELWWQAAHDLRGNLSVVATATAGLATSQARPSGQEAFLRLLQRNVGSLKNLLDDVTSLARLQAGREVRQLAEVDISETLKELCEGLNHQAKDKGLVLRCWGPTPMVVEADAVKVRRLAQNLLLNAIKYTALGRVTMRWGDSSSDDTKRWALTVQDTGPGFMASVVPTKAGALEVATNLLERNEAGALDALTPPQPPRGPSASDAPRSSAHVPGEGIGLSIVKRLCELLDATMEFSSAEGRGTTFRILLPRRYP